MTPEDLLRALDDPDAGEHPASFDRVQAYARCERLVRRLDEDFAAACRVDTAIEDAGHHARIEIPGAALVTGHPVVIVLSSFGSLAVAVVDNPGAQDEAETRALLDDADAVRVRDALRDGGYDQVPERVLRVPYDGRCRGPFRPDTWWVRYFDYL